MAIEKNPIKLFDKWFKEAQKTNIKEPNAVNLATSTKDGKPSNRMVLVKQYDDNGFVFFTNLGSKKASDIVENPFVSICYFWPETNKQVRIEGKVKQVSNKEADDYFNSRPLNSQIGAIISKQSQPILENDFNLFKNSTLESFKILSKGKIERPPYWSGFCLVPDKIEFWQRGEFRIHKRTSYAKVKDGWDVGFLYP